MILKIDFEFEYILRLGYSDFIYKHLEPAYKL